MSHCEGRRPFKMKPTRDWTGRDSLFAGIGFDCDDYCQFSSEEMRERESWAVLSSPGECWLLTLTNISLFHSELVITNISQYSPLQPVMSELTAEQTRHTEYWYRHCTLPVLSREIFNDKEWFCNLQPFEIFSDHKLVTKSHLITYDQDTYDYQHDKNINKWYVDDMSCHSPVDCRHNRMEFNIPRQAGGSRPSRQC